MRDLRKRCDWDAAQTHESLRPYLIEEAHEVDDALQRGDDARLREELAELEAELGRPEPDHVRVQDEIGDLLFAAVNLARKAGVHPALALDRANLKFATRFEGIEKLAAERGIAVADAGLAVLDAMW